MGNIYYFFVRLFGPYLSDYLWGYNCETEAFDATNVYFSIGLVMIAITLVLFLLYYLVGHPRFNRWWQWLIILILVFGVNLLVGGVWVNNHLSSGLIPDCLRYGMIEDGSVVINITSFHCWMFGLVNGIISAVLFFILSLMFKRFFRNCRHTPFKSRWPKYNK